MIEVQNLSFSYGKREIFKDLSITFEKGKLYAIIGPNGSGKTTLLHTLARLQKGNGTLSLDGAAYETIARRDFAKKLAILPQNRPIPEMRVIDLVSAGRYPYLDLSRTLREGDRAIVENALRFTDIAHLSAKSLQTLSGGERQRAYLAMLYAQDTPYVLLDEPTTHLDVAHAFAVMQILQSMRDDRKCVITVLHDLPLALKFADEIIILSGGEVAAIAPPAQIVDSGILERVFGVSCTAVEIDGRVAFVLSEPCDPIDASIQTFGGD